MFKDNDTLLEATIYKYNRFDLISAYIIGFVIGVLLVVGISAYAHPPCAQAPDQECSTITDIDLETGEVTYIYRCPGG